MLIAVGLAIMGWGAFAWTAWRMIKINDHQQAWLDDLTLRHQAACKEADSLAFGLRYFAIRGHWTVDRGRDGQPRWTGFERPWKAAQRALGSRWRPGLEDPDA